METEIIDNKTATQIWTLDKAHAKLGFSITHMLVSDVEGSFKKFDIRINTSKEDFSDASIELTAEVDSIDTQNEMRDAHMKRDDFFDQSKYPTISFKSTSFNKVNENKFELKGDFTLHGTTKPVVLIAKARVGKHPMNGSTIAGFKVTGTIKRSDFGLAPSAPGLMLSDEVELVANAEFIRA